MKKTLKDLALALLNATLILIALCLFLAWQAASTVDGLLATFARNLTIVQPLTDEVRGVRTEIAALRSGLAEATANAGTAALPELQRLADRAALVEARMDAAGERLDDLSAAPGALLDRAIEKAADEAVRGLADLKGCVPPEA